MTATRPWRIRLATLAALTGMSAALSTLPEVPAHATDPAPAVTAPAQAATLPEISMRCTPSQADLNHATSASLQAALGISAPIADRLIGLRPYLQVTDLLVVPGIGQGRLDQIVASGRACATPISTPPPSTEACTSADQIDLQSASRDDLEKRVGVSRPIAERIIVARPYAVLRHITPDRVPGVGKSTQDRIAKVGCLTPQPLTTASTSWRWAYPAYATTVTSGQYALTAPAGVIDSSAGAWLRITPLPSPADLPGKAIPTADMHVEGAWSGARSDGTPQTVTVTVPQGYYGSLIADGSQWEPLVLHELSSGGSEMIPATLNQNGTISAPVTSLSIVSALYRAFAWGVEVTYGALFGVRFQAPECTTHPWAQRPNTATYDAATQPTRATLTDALMNLPGNVVFPTGQPLKHCVENGPTIGGDSYASVRTEILNSTGSIFRLAGKTGGSVSKITRTDVFDVMLQAIEAVDHDPGVLLGPGEIGAVDVRPGNKGEADHRSQFVYSFAKIAGDLAFDEVLKLAREDGRTETLETIQRWAVCAIDVARDLSTDNVATFSRNVSLALAGCIDYKEFYVVQAFKIQQAVNDGAISNQVADARINRLLRFRDALRFLKVGKIVVAAADAISYSYHSFPFTAEHYLPVPATDAQGRPLDPKCVDNSNPYAPKANEGCQNAIYSDVNAPNGGGGDTGLPVGKIIRTPQGNAYLNYREESTGKYTLAPIADGGTYICLTRHYAVDWDANYQQYFNQAEVKPGISRNATCDGSLAPTRRVEPGQLGNAHVLRKSTGESFVENAGTLYPIRTGAEFRCWVNPQYAANIPSDVFDYVTDAELSRFARDNNSTISNCGDPTNPTF